MSRSDGISRVKKVALPLSAALLAFVFWDSLFLFPLKILVVVFHELSHGIAAILSGGSIERIEISARQGGVCYTRGGSRFLVLNAGYLGSLAWGAGLLMAGARSRRDTFIVGALGVVLLVSTLLYIRSAFGFVYGLLVGAVLVFTAVRLPDGVSDMLLAIIGSTSCFYAIWDIGSDILFRNVPESDAHLLDQLTGVPALVWGSVWVLLACLVTFFAFRVVSGRPRKNSMARQTR